MRIALLRSPRWTPNHAVTMRTCPVSRLRWRWAGGGWGGEWGPCERCVWHLIFLTMKDDNAVADANFLQMEKNARCLTSNCISGWLSEIRRCWHLFVRFLHLIKNHPSIKEHMNNTVIKLCLIEAHSSGWKNLNQRCKERQQPLPFHTVPWGGDRDGALAVFCIHRLIVVLVTQWTWCCCILLPLPLCLILMNL